MNAFWQDNGTKILGGLTAMLGTLSSLLSMGAFNELLTKPSIGWLSIFVSLATAGVGGTTIARGFNNSAQAKVATAMEAAIKATPGQGGFARIGLLLVVTIGAMLALAACTTTPVDVIQTACTPGTTYTAERCAKGIGETYEVYQTRAAEIVNDPSAPAEVKESVRAAEAITSDVVVRMLRAGAFYAEVKQQLAAGQTTEERVATANANLEQWVAKAIPLIRSFGDALGR